MWQLKNNLTTKGNKMQKLKQALENKFNHLIQHGAVAYDTTETADERDYLYDLYLDSFKPEDNRIYRERREYDCSACKQFIRNIAGVVFIKDNQKISLWDIDMDGTEFETVVKALSKHVHAASIKSIYLNDSKNVGIDHNHEECANGDIRTWEHLHLVLPSTMVQNTSYESIATKQSKANAIKQVLGRSLNEISEESVNTVIELIDQNSLYKGAEWLPVLKQFRDLKREYLTVDDKLKSNFIWDKSTQVGPVIGKIRNHSIGTLLVDISNGRDLNDAVKSYESIVAPTNYKRPKALFTKRMIEDAQKTINNLGLASALYRRFATAEDINVNDIAFVDRSVKDSLIGGDAFDMLAATTGVKPKSYDKVQTVPIEKFMTEILPTLTGLEALVETRHQRNFASLIAPVDQSVGRLFKWDNNFTWAYNGNMTDSDIRRNVEKNGGNIHGILRFSLQWNDELSHETDDLDAHCVEKYGTRRDNIYYGHKRSSLGGTLDVDIQHPKSNIPAVENIVYASKNNLQTGTYDFYVENYQRRSGTNGFKAELEVDGQIYQLNYDKPLRTDERVKVATVAYNDSTDEFDVKLHVSNEMASKDIWGITTNQFVPVSLVTLSPNYWGNEKGVGNKHYMFMLKDCINSDRPNGFYNEYLIPELSAHKRVFEALGAQLRVPETDNQLSGLGFSSTQENTLIVKAKGAVERTLKITF